MTKLPVPTRTQASTPPRTGADQVGTPTRRKAANIDAGVIGVVWPLAATASFPTLTRRCTAMLLDLLIAAPLLALAVIATEVSTGFSLRKYDALVRYGLTAYVMYSVYFALWESSRLHSTPGKTLVDLQVTTTTGNAIGFAAAMLRFWLGSATLLALDIGLLFAACDAHGRALHDRCCATLVTARDLPPGRLRTAVRLPRASDFACVLLAAALSYAAAYQLAPGVMQQLRVADAFDAALEEITAGPAGSDAAADGARLSRWRQDASAAASERGLTLDFDSDGRGATLRSLENSPSRVASADPIAPFVRLERVRSGPTAGEWSCTATGFRFYVTPRTCTPRPQISELTPAADQILWL